MARYTKHDPERQKRIDAQADKITELLGADPETVMYDGNYGVSLTPDQMDKLIDELVHQGWKIATDTLRDTGHTAAASVLDDHLAKAKLLLKLLQEPGVSSDV